MSLFLFYGPVLAIASSILRLPIIKNKLTDSNASVPILDQLLDIIASLLPFAISLFFMWLFSFVTLPLISKGIIATLLLIYSSIDYAHTISQYKDLNLNIKLIPLQIIIFLNSKKIFGVIKRAPTALFSTSWIKTSLRFMYNYGRTLGKTFKLLFVTFQGIAIPVIISATLLSLLGVSLYYSHTTHYLSLLSILTTLALCYVGYTQFIALGLMLPLLSFRKVFSQYNLLPKLHIEYISYIFLAALWLVYLIPALIHAIPTYLLITLIYTTCILLAHQYDLLRQPLACISVFIGLLLWPYVSSFQIAFLIIHAIIPAVYFYHRLANAQPDLAKKLMAISIIVIFLSYAFWPIIITHTYYRQLSLGLLFTIGLSLKSNEANMIFQIVSSLILFAALLTPVAIPLNIIYVLNILSFSLSAFPCFKWHYSKGARKTDQAGFYLILSSVTLLLPEALGLFVNGTFTYILPLFSVIGGIMTSIIAHMPDIHKSIQKPFKVASFGILLSSLSKALQVHPATRTSAYIFSAIGQLTTSISTLAISAKRLENRR